MVNVVHGENSSSQNAKLLVSVRRKKGTTSALYIEAEDGSSFFCLSSLASQHKLRRGLEISLDLWTDLAHQSALTLAYQKSIELLTRREHTRKELEIGLIQRGYSRDVIHHVMENLIERGYLSHRRYAEVWLRSRLRKHPEGLAHLKQRLMVKGLSSNDANEALQELLQENPELETEACKSAIIQLSGKCKNQQDLEKKLLNRGFTFSTIRLLTHFIHNSLS